MEEMSVRYVIVFLIVAVLVLVVGMALAVIASDTDDWYKELDDRIEGLIDINKREVFEKNNIKVEEPDLEQIMVYIERSKKEDESFDL